MTDREADEIREELKQIRLLLEKLSKNQEEIVTALLNEILKFEITYTNGKRPAPIDFEKIMKGISKQ